MSAVALVRRLLGAVQSTAARVGFGLVAVALAVWAVARSWHDVVHALARLEPGWLVLAAAATVANLLLSGMAWRAILADLGSRLPYTAVARVFFVGQVGKYVPGSLWPVVVQAELGRDHGVPRRRSAAASVVLILLSALSALLVTLACLPFVPSVADGGFAWTLLLLVPLFVVLHPRVLGRVLDRGMRMLGRRPPGEWTSLRGTAVALGWAVAAWAAAGLQVWCLAVSAGAARTGHLVALATGGYALAWAVGLVVVVAPAGVGAREVALGALLGTVLGSGAVVVVVLISRVLFTAADLGLAGIGFWLGRSGARREVVDGAPARLPR